MDMNISERDIFNFIFFDSLLSEQKRAFIKNNSDDFEQIKFYKRLKRKFNSNIERKTKQIIASKISAYRLSSQINLFPVSKNSDNKLYQIANSPVTLTDKKVNHNVKTFVDDDGLFIVRIVKTKKTALIYLFSVKKFATTDAKLIIQPANQHFKINKKNEPIKVKNLGKVESITLEII